MTIEAVHIGNSRERQTSPLSNEDILLLIIERVRIKAELRTKWLRKIWRDVANQQQNDLHPEIDIYLNVVDNAVDESQWQQDESDSRELLERVDKIEKVLAGDRTSNWYRLANIFHLQPAELDILQACISLYMDSNLGRVFAFLQDHEDRPYVTIPLIIRLFQHNDFAGLDSGASLLRWKLIQEHFRGAGEPSYLQCDTFIQQFLLGITDRDEFLNDLISPVSCPAPLDHWPVDSAYNHIRQIQDTESSPPVRIFVAGSAGSGRKSFAAVLARRFNMELMMIRADRITDTQWPDVYLHAQRQAHICHHSLGWTAAALQDKQWPLSIAIFPIQFVFGDETEFIQPSQGIVDYRVVLPPLSADAIRVLWTKFLPKSITWSDENLNRLAHRSSTTIGHIVHAARKGLTTYTEVSTNIRNEDALRLGKLAQLMSSEFAWNDVVLSDKLKRSLEDFCYEALNRATLWERPNVSRLFPQGRGLIALFTGPPGTGKTMTAQIIANSLQLDLFRIDLSAVTSKYVGETSKNIEKILSQAKNMDIVLMFDEADSLFGKRTEIKDAHDRFANADTNYLLQAIEEFPGTIIMASNKKVNIDTSFLRRIRYVLEFPKPDAEQRHKLFRQILTAFTDEDTVWKLDNDLSKLSEMLDLTGAQIKMGLLSALFIGRRENEDFNIKHLLRGLERELLKDGRGLGPQVIQTFNLKTDDANK